VKVGKTMFNHERESENFSLYKPSFLEVFLQSKVSLFFAGLLVAIFVYAFIVFSILHFQTMSFILQVFVYVVVFLVCYGSLLIMASMTVSFIGHVRKVFKINVKFVKGDESVSVVIENPKQEVTELEEDDLVIDDISTQILNLIEGGHKKMEIIQLIWGVKSGKKYQEASRMFDSVLQEKSPSF
jgi:hypothetical protein